MGGIELLDHAVIDADQLMVFRATEDLVRGRAQWWLPRVEIRPRSRPEADLVGFEYDMIPRRPRGQYVTVRITEVQAHEIIEVEYIDSLLPGRGTMTLTPADGKTAVTYHWQVRPRHRVLELLNPFIRRMHTKVYMPAYFDGLRRYVSPEPRTQTG